MEGEAKSSPVFHSDDIKSSKANSDKNYFVNVIDDPFQQWLLRKKPAKVKVKQDFETPVSAPKEPEEKPKAPQCRTTIRLTTERLRRDTSRFKIPFVLLSVAAFVILGLATFFAYLAFFGEKKVETKTVYVDAPAECPVVNCENSENPSDGADDSNSETSENSDVSNENSENPSENPAPSENPDESGENSNDPSEIPEPVRGGGGEINA